MSTAERVFLSREAILNVSDLQQEEVFIAEWNGYVIVRGMNGAERDAFEASMVEKRGKSREVNLANIRAKLVAKTVIGPDGKRLFSDHDAEALGKKSAAALQRIFEVAQRLSGLSNEDVEELAGNSATTQGEGLPFG